MREGFFRVVLVLPPAATWFEACHFGTGGQPPVRSRAQPCSITHTTDIRYTKLAHDNRSVEISTRWRALLCIFPEDFRKHAKSGPASLWSLKELRSLHGEDDAARGATFPCRIAGADSKKPIGIFTHLPGLLKSLRPSWPTLEEHGVPNYDIVDNCQKPVDALFLIRLALESLPTRISTLVFQSHWERGFGNFVSRLFTAHQSANPLRLRMLQLLRIHVCSHSTLCRTPGRYFMITGDSANSPDILYGKSQTPSVSMSTSQVFLQPGSQP